MQKKTKGKTPKSKVEIPIHEALEEYLLSGPTSGAPNAPVFPELHGKPGSGKSGLSMAFKLTGHASADMNIIITSLKPSGAQSRHSRGCRRSNGPRRHVALVRAVPRAK